jgi:hypothetical protein
MGDISSTEATEAVRVVGADSTTGAEQTPVGSTVNGDLQTVDIPNTAGAYGTVNITTTAAELKVGGTALAGRKMVSIQPIDGKIYYGYDNSVTSSNGTELAKKQIIVFTVGAGISVYLVSAAGTVDVRIGELA